MESVYQKALLNDDLRNYVNLLDLPKLDGASRLLKGNSYQLTRDLSFPWFADLRYCYNTPLNHCYPNITHCVMKSERIIAIAKTLAEEKKVSESVFIKQAAKFLNQMKASFSKVLCRLAGWIMFKLFRRVTRRILVSPPQLERLKNADGSGIPIVYLPLHRSHLDHMLITWTLYHWGIRLPHIASGDNLNLNGLGWLLRAFGAFFIRRKVDDDFKQIAEENNTGNELYREVLNTYMTTLLKHGMSIEFFLEGTRSRFGKALLPKNGLISNIVAAVREKEIPDVFIVPVGISYDNILEGIFHDELMGVRKKKESVWVLFVVSLVALVAEEDVELLWSISEHLEKLSANIVKHKGLINLKHETNPFSYRELVPWHNFVDEPMERMLIRAVGYDAVYQAQRSKPINVAALTSLLFLCNHRKQPVLLKDFLVDLKLLIEEVHYLGYYVVGWDQNIVDIGPLFEDGYRFLRHLISKDFGTDGSILLRMSCNQPRCYLEIAYHKNNALPPFGLISMAALSVLSMSDHSEVTGDEYIEKCLLVCNVLQCEIIFCSPTEDLRMEITKALDYLGISALDKPVIFDASNLSKHATFGLLFYANILRPFLHTLLVTIYDLVVDPFEKEMTDKQYVRNLLNKCVQANKYASGDFPVCEAINSDSMHNAIKFLRFKQIVRKEGMQLIDQELAERYVGIVHDLLAKIDGPLSTPVSHPRSELRSQKEKSSVQDS
uniref:Phospholipid/glycerol acyltransferase domain-containing protein n=1 Tax=Ditylenchus dipsaci TaxID=166011 RepID=A0A915DK78_9BILA